MSGGGTAGHVYPALSVAALLVAEGDRVQFVGTPGGLEARLVPEAGIPFHALDASGFDRSRPWTLVTSSVRIFASAFAASRLLTRLRPDVVMGFGGYVSIPVGVAAILRRVPLVIHEQNSVPGLANRFLSKWATATALTYESSQGLISRPERATVTGNPVRLPVLNAQREAGRAALGVPPNALMLLAFGGSRGARHLNRALVGLRDRILSHGDVFVLHVAGSLDFADTTETLLAAGGGDDRWLVLEYLDDMPSALAAADVIVSRAGATSIAEITSRGVPAVLVPYPYATDDHQTTNAEAVANAGGAVVVADADLDEPVFGDAVERLLGDSALRANMAAASKAVGRPDAAERVVALAREAASHHTSKR